LTATERSFIILNMSSAHRASDTVSASAPAIAGPDAGDDLTARARIRDAAITRFAADGVARATVRAIASEAGVSPALVIHHFGSKDALRVACDQHVAASIRERKSAAVAEGAGLDPLAALRSASDGPPVLRYLATTLTDGSPHVAELLDDMIDDAVTYMAEGVASGMLRPTDDPRGRATVLVLWSLGALALHEHVERLLGVRLVDDPSEALAYLRPAVDILAAGVLTPAAATQMQAAFASKASERDTTDQEARS
jgi:AcrR family transcriptional regulator